MSHSESILQAVAPRASEKGCLPRTLIVVAHPDDEVLALGGRLSRHRHSVFVHITDGAPLDGADARLHGCDSVAQYREQRMQELRDALQLAKISDSISYRLEIADQRASFCLNYLSAFLERILAEFNFDAILTHPYEGGHPDHDACAFAVHTAARRSAAASRPVIVEAAFYHAGPHGIETNRFVPAAAATAQVTRHLSAEEKEAKEALLSCFPTQRDTLRYFDTGVERYRIAPTYDFTRPPHAGELFYERFPWGMTGERFCRLASLALAEEVVPCL